MVQNQHIWTDWQKVLHRWGMEDMVATILEAVSPLNFLGAQAIYLSQPILNTLVPKDHVGALASLLENPEETKAFTTFLKQNKWEV